MIERPMFVLTFASALGSGLIAGAFFAFSTFVMQALAQLPPAQGIATMQSINIVVLNRWFLGVFVGTAVLCIAVGIAALVWRPSGTAYLLAGSLLYVIGTFLVTMLFNVPRNNALAGVASNSVEGARLWSAYLVEWTMWNHVRTVAALAAMAALILAPIAQSRGIGTP